MTVVVRGQLVVGTKLKHVTIAKHEENVAVSDRAQSVGDHNRSTAFHCAIKSLLYDLLTLFIQSRSGLVKYENSWVFDKSTSDCNSLLLTTRQFAALETAVLAEAFVQGEFSVSIAKSVNLLELKLIIALVDLSHPVGGLLSKHQVDELVFILSSYD